MTSNGQRVLVTGACGRLGTLVVQDLLDHGYEVAGADRVVRRDGPIRFIETDLTDVGQVAFAARGCTGIVHLGAIPSPYGHPDEVVLRNNTGATFAVLQAASLLSIRVAVIASSVSAYGMAWSPVPFNPLYVPIDEEHPLRNHDAYGLSKEIDETTARMFVRREGMSIAALRFHWIASRDQAIVRGQGPDPERGVREVWAYVEEHDAARACRLALDAAGKGEFGFEPFNIVAADTTANGETEAMLREHDPAIEIRSPLPGFTGGFDTSKARRLLGWEPQFSWRDAAGEGM